ncbi:MAG: hypothetical protein AAGF13_04875 [Pseudomonadota bacterium]
MSLRTYRCSLHLTDRDATALTDEIDLLRHCFAAEMKQSWMEVHGACVLPHALYLVVSMQENEDPVARLKRLGAAFKKHSESDLAWMYPVVGPSSAEEVAGDVEECLMRPVHWGLTTRAEEWPYSSAAAKKRLATTA